MFGFRSPFASRDGDSLFQSDVEGTIRVARCVLYYYYHHCLAKINPYQGKRVYNTPGRIQPLTLIPIHILIQLIHSHIKNLSLGDQDLPSLVKMVIIVMDSPLGVGPDTPIHDLDGRFAGRGGISLHIIEREEHLGGDDEERDQLHLWVEEDGVSPRCPGGCVCEGVG